MALRLPSVATLKTKFRCSEAKAKQFRTDLANANGISSVLRICENFTGASPPTSNRKHGRDSKNGKGTTCVKIYNTKGVSIKPTFEVLWTGDKMTKRVVTEIRPTTYQQWIKKHGPEVPFVK